MCNILNNSLLFYYDNTCIYSKKLLQKLKEINKKSNNKIYLEAIKKAITFIRRYHAGQMRKSGEPFYSHPLEVASFVSYYSFSTEVIITGILHDVVEDTKISSTSIKFIFGKNVSKVVSMLTDLDEKLNRTFKPGKDVLLYKKIKTFNKDASLIKVCDRLHNMRTLGSMKIEKQKKKALETLQTYVLMANNIGLPDLASELETLSKKRL